MDDVREPTPTEEPESAAAGRARIVVAPGPRAAEDALLAEVERLLGPARETPELLATPVLVVVPSRSLRLHLSSELVRRRGLAAAGVDIVTLYRLAARVLEQAGEPLPAGEALAGLLARRLARRERALAEPLEPLVEGYGAVAGTVRDFVDAGFTPDHREALLDRIESGGEPDADEPLRTPPIGSRPERQRAAALVRLAAAVEQEMEREGAGGLGHLFRRATDLLRGAPDRLRARAVLVHGFANATGVASDLLEALLARPRGVFILDRPPDPADPADRDSQEHRFTERLFERMAATGAAVERVGDRPEPARLAAFAAPGADAEAREIARRVRGLLDGAEPPAPETIGVVVRDLSSDRPHAAALRRAFERSGIPFSGVGAHGPLLPAGRRVLALVDLLHRREGTPTGRWLGARAAQGGDPLDLRLAFHAMGAGRVGEVAALPSARFGRESFALPLRQGLGDGGGSDGEDGPDDDGEGGDDRAGPAGAPRRRVRSEHLREAAAAARRLVRRLDGWPEEAPLADHLDRLRELLCDDLGWSSPEPLLAPLAAAVDGIRSDLPLAFDELVFLVDRACRAGGTAGRDRLGGAGGGVAVIDAIEARGRTFRHLFLAGVDRNTFPRVVREDPLLADDLRRSLRTLLPDLPVKREGFDEERYLFAQLLAAAPEVTLSWRTATEEGQPLPPSPLVERLALHRPEVHAALRGPHAATAPADDGEAAEDGPRPAREHAIAAGLAGRRDAFVPLLGIALASGRTALGERGPDGEEDDRAFRDALAPAARLATVHGAVLDEMDPDLATPEGRALRSRLGPYFGFVGPAATASRHDPRTGPLSVTALEGLAACPWQTFLTRLLRIEPTHDPLGALPALDALRVGSLVHAALETIVRDGLRAAGVEEGDRRLESVLHEAREPVPVAWPEREALDRLLRREAEALLESEGVVLPGLARALANAARPFVGAAGAVEWEAGPLPVLAAEASGALTVEDAEGRGRELHFRADRVDSVPGRRNPAYRLTDYKTGRPISTAKKEETRRNHLLREIEAGRRLQAVAYALAAGVPSPFQPDGIGRYLFLRPGLPAEQREFTVWSSTVPSAEAFRRAVRTALEAWDRGAFFPRLVEPDRDEEPGRCKFCAVHEACLRGDSGARGRLAAWASAHRQPSIDGVGTEVPRAERALLGVWLLPSKEPA